MIRAQPASKGTSPVLLRLSRLTPLTPGDEAALEDAVQASQPMRARRELFGEGQEITGAKILVSGWAARVRILSDGRRQLLSLVLPGDLVGACRHTRPLAVSSVVALTDVAFCPAPSADDSPGLGEAYALSRALEEAYLLAHITRLGRLNAQERITDLMLELHERLDLVGLVNAGEFELPLTQETLADVVGLTSVHVNRTIQEMRRSGDLLWKSGRVVLTDPEFLRQRVGRPLTRVTASPTA